MKKQLLTAILALASLAATAATGSGTFYLGGQSKWDGYGKESIAPSADTSSRPFNSKYKFSSCQVILTPEALSTIVPTTAADGTTTYANIKTLTIKANANGFMGSYGEGTGSLDITVYVENIDPAAFPKEGSQTKWHPYTTEKASKCTISATEIPEYDFDIEFAVPEGLKYSGQGLLLTFVTQNTCEAYDSELDAGTYTLGSTAPGISGCACAMDANGKALNPMTSGNISPTATVPDIKFDYELVEEKIGPTVTGSGSFNLGGQSKWDGYGSGSNPLASESVPFISTNTYSSCQAILTPDALTSIVPTTAADGTTTYANIKTLTIKAYSNAFYGCFGGDGSLDITLYIENIDPASFPKKGSDFTWHPFSTENPIKVSISATEVPADETFDITFTLPEGLKYDGQGLLLTFFTENTCEYYGEIMDAGVYTVAISGCACAMDSKDSGLNPMTSGTISPDSEVPDIKFDYDIVEEKAGASQDVVSFESVTYSTNVVTGTSSTSTRLNNLAVHFTINDPADHAPYTIKQGNDVIGTVSTKEGTINFFQKPAKDVILSVVPTGDAIGTTATVPADAFDAFFGAPTVEPVATGLWGEIDLKYNTPTKVDCSGVAQFRVTASTDAAYFNITSTGAQIITENSDLPEGFEGFYPAGAWNDIKACNGLVAYRKVGSIVSATLKGGMFTWPSSRMSIALGFGVNYPLVNATPAVSDGDVTPAAAPAKAGETKLVVKYNNGSSYSADQCSAVFDEASTLTHFSYVYPNDLAFRDLTETEGCIMFVAPEGHKLQHAVEELLPATPAAKAVAREVTDEAEGEHAWEDLDGQIATYAIDDYRGKNIHIRSIDETGATSGHLSYGIDADGNVSGIADALAPAEAEAQWFNLQGIEIAEPAAAGIYIRRQGNSAVKVIIK